METRALSTSGLLSYKCALWIIFLTLVIISSKLNAQTKHDVVWTLGYNSNDTLETFGGNNLTFGTEGISQEYVYRDLDFQGTCASICDKNGNLLMYSNGSRIMNSQQEYVENGENLCFGEAWIDDWYCSDGFPFPYSAFFLPDSYNEDLYHLIHCNVDTSEQLIAFSDSLFITTIDVSENSGLGKVINKKSIIRQDSMYIGGFSAVKHANGLDWWILVPTLGGNEINVYEFNQNELELSHSQEIGESRDRSNFNSFISLFSENGEKWVTYNTSTRYSVYDFDRNTGLLSNYLQFDFSMAEEVNSCYGLAISPNSRFLYSSIYGKYLVQFDLNSLDIEESQILIDSFDGFQGEFLSTTFGSPQLAPDGKIYISTSNGTRYYHTIHNPNELGVNCNFLQHDLELLTFNYFGISFTPNYDLGSILSNEQIDGLGKIRVLPNPSEEYIEIRSDYSFKKHNIYSMHGTLLKTDTNHIIDVGFLTKGIYLIHSKLNNGKVLVNKFVKI